MRAIICVSCLLLRDRRRSAASGEFSERYKFFEMKFSLGSLFAGDWGREWLGALASLRDDNEMHR